MSKSWPEFLLSASFNLEIIACELINSWMRPIVFLLNSMVIRQKLAAKMNLAGRPQFCPSRKKVVLPDLSSVQQSFKALSCSNLTEQKIPKTVLWDGTAQNYLTPYKSVQLYIVTERTLTHRTSLSSHEIHLAFLSSPLLQSSSKSDIE